MQSRYVSERSIMKGKCLSASYGHLWSRFQQSGSRTNIYLHSAAEQVWIGQTDSSQEDKTGNGRYSWRNYAIDTVEIGCTYTAYGVLLERSPLVTGLAVTFLFVQNRDLFGPLADNVSCGSLGEFFEDSANSNRYVRFTKTIINSLISVFSFASIKAAIFKGIENNVKIYIHHFRENL